MESGIYIRVGSENILLEDMTEAQRTVWLTSLEKDGLIRTVNRLCDCLNMYTITENNKNGMED